MFSAQWTAWETPGCTQNWTCSHQGLSVVFLLGLFLWQILANITKITGYWKSFRTAIVLPCPLYVPARRNCACHHAFQIDNKKLSSSHTFYTSYLVDNKYLCLFDVSVASPNLPDILPTFRVPNLMFLQCHLYQVYDLHAGRVFVPQFGWVSYCSF